MSNMRVRRQQFRSRCGNTSLRLFGVFALAAILCACEAPLNLQQVEAEDGKILHRYDMFQAAAHAGERVAVVSSVGAIVVSANNGSDWQRYELPGRPALIDITACASGDFYALDTQRRVWRHSEESDQWQSVTIDTIENTLSIHCAPNGRLWVSASFGTLFWADSSLEQWHEFSLNEDFQFTAVRFLDEMNGYALGEFGVVAASVDGGDSWELRNPIPNEFYPMAVDFLDVTTGWAGGLDGVIWHTVDGGHSWQRQESITSTPIYNIHATAEGIYAVGGSAKLVEFRDGQWLTFKGAPKVLAYLRGIDLLASGDLLVAGGGGTLAVISLNGRESGGAQ